MTRLDRRTFSSEDKFKTIGGLRVTWFWDADYAVICGRCFIKKSKKTPWKELENARKWQGWYKKERSIRTINL